MKIYQAGTTEIWLTAHATNPRKGWIGIFNRSHSPVKVALTKQDLGFVAFEESYKLTTTPRPVHLRDIWSGGKTYTITNEHPFEIPGQDVAFLEFEME
jgi:alpha-galactosidase